MYNCQQRLSNEATQKLRRAGGQYIRDLRIAAGLSQKQISEILGLEFYTFVSAVETGRGRIPPDSYEVWAKALNVDLRVFVRNIMRFYDPVTYRILFTLSEVTAI